MRVQSVGRAPDSASERALSPEDLHALLANRRRRYTIRALDTERGPVALGTLAEGLAAAEHGIAPTAVTSVQRKVAYTALQQHHLPKLDRAGLVRFDRREGVVTPTPRLADIAAAAGAERPTTVPWHALSLALATVLFLGLGGVWLGAIPLGPGVALAAGTLLAGTLAVTALAHTLAVRRSSTSPGAEPMELPPRE